MADGRFAAANEDIIQAMLESRDSKNNKNVVKTSENILGNDEVVHIASTDNDGINSVSGSGSAFSFSGVTCDKAEVKRENIWDVVSDSIVKINNGKDKYFAPRPAHEIVREALERVGDIGYNVLWKNCEHFAAFCRYRVNCSEQADRALVGIVVAGAGIVIGGLIRAAFGPNDQKN